MKKILLAACFSIGLITFQAEASSMSEQTVELGHGRYYHGRHHKGNMNVRDLPSNITKYLNKHYNNYDILVSKRRGNGYYYVKISYDGNSHHPYYRSLIFDEKGKVVKN